MLFSLLDTLKWGWTRSHCNLCLLKHFMSLTFPVVSVKAQYWGNGDHFQEQKYPPPPHTHTNTHLSQSFQSCPATTSPLLASFSHAPVSSGAWVKHKKQEHNGLFSDCLVMGRPVRLMHAHTCTSTHSNTHTVSGEEDGMSSEPLPLRLKQTLSSLGSLANHNR